MDFNEILSKMKPEHAEVIQKAFETKDAELSKAREDLTTTQQNLTEKDNALTEANDALAKANAELETLKAKDCSCEGEADDNDNGVCKSCGKPKKSAAFDETETLKAMPEAARAMFLKMRAQKEAAEEQVRKNAEEKAEADAIAKAASLKAIPVAQDKLVGILKNCTPEFTELLTTINTAIENAVLDEVGKNRGNGADLSGASTTSDEAWAKLEKKAEEVAKRDSVTKEKAMATVITENPDLYREYLNGGVK